jgi:hypothetical protein
LLKKTLSVLATISLTAAGTALISSPASSSPQVAFQKIGDNPPSPFNPYALENSGASGHQLVSSADGTKLLMANTGHFNNNNVADASDVLYRSEDSGRTWAALANSPIGEWGVVASSADGMKLAAASNGPNGGDGKIWVSADGGANWTESVIHDRIQGADNFFWWDLNMTADGTKMVATADHTNVPFKSLDGGLNWYPISGFALSQYRNITLSNDGSRVILCDNDHGFKVANVSIVTATSADFNVSIPFSAQNYFCGSIAASADASTFVADSYSGNDGAVYKYQAGQWVQTATVNFAFGWSTLASISDDGQTIAFGGDINDFDFISQDGGASFQRIQTADFANRTGWMWVQPDGANVFSVGIDGFYALNDVSAPSSTPSPSASPAATSSANQVVVPKFQPVATRRISSTAGGELTLTGAFLDVIQSVSINGVTLKQLSGSSSFVTYQVLAGVPGEVTLAIKFVGGSLSWVNAFSYIDPASVKPAFVYHAPKRKAKK